MSFVVLGIVSGALLMSASLATEGLMRKTEKDTPAQTETYLTLPVETQLQKMKGKLALPLFATVLSLLFGFGMLRVLRDRRSPKEANKADSLHLHDHVVP